MDDHVKGIVDSIKWRLKERNEKNEPLPSHILIKEQSLFDLIDELERTEREKDAAQAELVQIKLKHGDEEGIVSAAYLFQKAEQEARVYMRRQLEAAAPKWISVKERPPECGQRVLAVDEDGYMMTGDIICVTGYEQPRYYCENGYDSLNYVTHWMPLPEPPKENADA